MFRKTVAKHIEKSSLEFQHRGHDVKRIETFSDAVFAFAVTLLIVSLEVPKNFEELAIGMQGFFAFGICFTLLMLIWYEQNIFFRRYNLNDPLTITLNCMLIFLVLFYVYPLKFLFTFLFNQKINGNLNSFKITGGQSQDLMIIYAAGYVAIYLIFFLMYLHALRKKMQLQLTWIEEFETRTRMFASLVLILIGVVSILLSIILPVSQIYLAGLTYVLIGPSLTMFYFFRARNRKASQR